MKEEIPNGMTQLYEDTFPKWARNIENDVEWQIAHGAYDDIDSCLWWLKRNGWHYVLETGTEDFSEFNVDLGKDLFLTKQRIETDGSTPLVALHRAMIEASKKKENK